MLILKHGDQNGDVKRLQRILNSLLKPPPHLREDGDFGAKTQIAILRFQKDHGLDPDGVVGPHTWTALGQKIAVAPAPKITIPPGDAAKRDWMEIAREELKLQVKALPGADTNPKILEYFDTTTYHPGDDEAPWCSAFVNWVMTQAKYKGTNSAGAASWLDWKDGSVLSEPKPGAITVIYYKARAEKIEGCKPMTTGTGNHVAFYVSSTDTHIRLLGGNQGRKVSEVGFPLKCWKIKGYRWPS